VSRYDSEWLTDIIDAIGAIREYQQRGDLSDGLIFDAIRLRLIEIGQAMKRVDEATLALEPEVPWGDIAGMRDCLAHRHFTCDRPSNNRQRPS
jgi:uncharacterized protein with HEPN domain